MPEEDIAATQHNGGRKHELPDRLLREVDDAVVHFLRMQVDSFIKWDLVQFFYRNPGTMDTAENVARYIGRSSVNVDQEMGELAVGGVLNEHRMNGTSVFSLTREPGVRDLLQRFAESCDDQQFRLNAIYYIVRSLR